MLRSLLWLPSTYGGRAAFVPTRAPVSHRAQRMCLSRIPGCSGLPLASLSPAAPGQSPSTASEGPCTGQPLNNSPRPPGPPRTPAPPPYFAPGIPCPVQPGAAPSPVPTPSAPGFCRYRSSTPSPPWASTQLWGPTHPASPLQPLPGPWHRSPTPPSQAFSRAASLLLPAP